MRYPHFTTFLQFGVVTGLLIFFFAFLGCGNLQASDNCVNLHPVPKSLCQIANIDFLTNSEVENPGFNSSTHEISESDKSKKKPCSLFKQYNTFWILASKSAACEIHNFDNSHINRIPEVEHLWRLLKVSTLPSPVRAGPFSV